MKLQRTFICIAGVFIAVGFAASQASAGTGVPGCSAGTAEMEIDVNTLRAGGGRTIVTSPNDTTQVTSKARILKGTAPAGTTMLATMIVEASTDILTCIPREGNVCIPDVENFPPDGDPGCVLHPKVPIDPDPTCQEHDPELVDTVLGTSTAQNITLGVGKGGKGATVFVLTQECGDSGFITITSTFVGEDEEGETCQGDKRISKLCR